MNPYSLSLLLFAFGSFFVGLLIWFRRQDDIGRGYFLFSLCLTIWGVGFSVMANDGSTYERALFFGRVADAGAVFIAITWFHFAAVLANQINKYKRVIILLYAVGALIDCFAFTSWFIPRVAPAMQFKHFVRAGFLFHFFTFTYITIMPSGFVLLYKQIKKVSGAERVQLIGLFFALLVGFIGGSFAFFPKYEIMIPLYSIFLLPVYPFILGYFVIRHRLFDFEAAVQAFQKEKLATIGLLAASINHEIRNPLYAVKGLLETYIENEKEGLPRKTPLETSEKALKQVQRALEVIQKLNRFAKPAIEDSNQIASIPEAVQTVSDLISYEFSLEKIEIKNLLPKDLPKIKADQRQLEEIFFNLIVNACHAMSNGGELVIASERSERSNPGTVQITISDTGTGISPEQAKHLFEPFHTTKGDKGTGLGLYITKQLIERNGGKISVQSKPGQGTSFILEFKAK